LFLIEKINNYLFLFLQIKMAVPISDLDFTSLRRMIWTDEAYNEISQYLKDGTLPKNKFIER
jgi:hypothetical protein